MSDVKRLDNPESMDGVKDFLSDIDAANPDAAPNEIYVATNAAEDPILADGIYPGDGCVWLELVEDQNPDFDVPLSDIECIKAKW